MFVKTVSAVSISADTTVTALVLGVPPTMPATITQPTNNSVVETTPMVVRGSCGAGLTVRVYDNGQLVGSVQCAIDDSYVMNITLLVGNNVLTALNFDFQEQPGPVSPSVTVTVKLPEPEVETVIGAEAQNTAAGTISGGTTDTTDDGAVGSGVRLFEGSVVEPLAKVLGVEQIVSPTTNTVTTTLINLIFILSIGGAIFLIFVKPPFI